VGGSYPDEEYHDQGCGQVCKGAIMYRFGIPQTIKIDQRFVFILEEFKKFKEDMGIALI
jgi:hypothetical protein